MGHAENSLFVRRLTMSTVCLILGNEVLAPLHLLDNNYIISILYQLLNTCELRITDLFTFQHFIMGHIGLLQIALSIQMQKMYTRVYDTFGYAFPLLFLFKGIFLHSPYVKCLIYLKQTYLKLSHLLSTMYVKTRCSESFHLNKINHHALTNVTDSNNIAFSPRQLLQITSARYTHNHMYIFRNLANVNDIILLPIFSFYSI